MLRRGCFGFLHALLALALLLGVPASRASGAQAPAVTPAADARESFWTKGAPRQDKLQNALVERIDGDDTPDHVPQVGAVVYWSAEAASGIAWPAADVVCNTHPACAAPARGPPTA